jgi:hypothetical protein
LGRGDYSASKGSEEGADFSEAFAIYCSAPVASSGAPPWTPARTTTLINRRTIVNGFAVGSTDGKTPSFPTGPQLGSGTAHLFEHSVSNSVGSYSMKNRSFRSPTLRGVRRDW